MDSITQIVLGAAVGEAVLGKKAGNKAVLWGAVAGTIPDLDIFASHFMPVLDALLFHRSVTHSFLFAAVLSPLLGILISKLYNQKYGNWQEWSLLFFLGFTTHALLDTFTTWGTQLFWPHTYRAAIKSIFVIDPLYTVPFLICLVWLIFLKRENPKRRKLAYTGIILSSTYLLITLMIKLHVNNVFQEAFKTQNINIIQYDTKPTPLNTILWSANVDSDTGYYIGYYSLLDDKKPELFNYFPKKHELLQPYLQHPEIQKLITLTEGWYTVEKQEDGFIVNDLRFGQNTGWQTGTGSFVFAYKVKIENNNSDNQQITVTQQPNTVRDGVKMLKQFWQRIKGN